MARLATNWNVWRELDQLQNELNNLFTSRRRGGGFFTRPDFPPVNIWRDEHSAVLAAELPGLEPDELDVTVMADTVTIRGSRKVRELNEGESWLRRERPAEPFTRSIELPFEVDPQNAEAKYEKGILTIRLQRPEQQKPRRVQIKAG